MTSTEDKLEEFDSIKIEIRPGGKETEWYPMRLLEDFVDQEAGLPVPPRVVISLYAVRKNHALRQWLGQAYYVRHQVLGKGKRKKTNTLEFFTEEQMLAALERG